MRIYLLQMAKSTQCSQRGRPSLGGTSARIDENYADFWAGEAEYIRANTQIVNDWFTIGGEELKPYDLGINVLVYALTQEGSLARRLVSAE